MKLPPARNENIIIQDLGAELLVYDLAINKAYCLNDTAAHVFQACGNNQTFADLKREFKFTDELIYLALDELRRQNLLADDSFPSPLAALSRREAVKRVGLASLLALPVITGLIAPTAAHAASRAACVNTTGPQRPPNMFLGYRSPEFCANDAFTCCSNSTRYNPDDSIEINNLTHQRGYACYCN